jgi:DNA-binding CsgD family transcriptional regulator
LTPTELRVAQLAAQGGSNRDIAEQIFVSRNTVAWHLRNVYRKVHVDSREQLARLLLA